MALASEAGPGRPKPPGGLHAMLGGAVISPVVGLRIEVSSATLSTSPPNGTSHSPREQQGGGTRLRGGSFPTLEATRGHVH